jgi:hypothetical protein
VIALEHGYPSWAAFVRWLETRAPDPPVGRIGRAPVAHYEARAQALMAAMDAGEADAARRVQHHVPRWHDSPPPTLSAPDARLVVAREYGFPTWRDLVGTVQKTIDEHVDEPSGELAVAFACIRAGDVDGLARLLDAQPGLVTERYPGAATTLLEAIAQPDVFGDRLGQELGVDPRLVDLLIARGSALEGPLNLAACFNRTALVARLLAAGATIGHDAMWGLTPLQAALYHGSREAADLLAAVALVPDTLYAAAGVGSGPAIARWFVDGELVDAARQGPRPNLADVGWPPGPPPLDTAQAVLDEAFALAAYNGRLEALADLLARGAAVDGVLHLGLTGLHLAVIRRRVDVATWLVAHGARLDLRDQIHHGTPAGWAAHNAAGAPIDAYLRSVTPPE